MDDKILLAAFYNGVTSSLFIHKLYDQERQTMAKLIHSAQGFMNVEDAIINKKKKKAEWMEAAYVHHLEQGTCPKKAKTGKKRDWDGKKVGLSSGRYSNYTPLNDLLDQVLMQIEDDLSLKWLENMTGDPRKRSKSKYFRFCWDHEHDTDECYDLKQQIEVLIKQGKLKNFLRRDHKNERQPLKGKVEEPVHQPLGEIRVIVGGTSTRSSSKAKRTYLWVVVMEVMQIG